MENSVWFIINFFKRFKYQAFSKLIIFQKCSNHKAGKNYDATLPVLQSRLDLNRYRFPNQKKSAPAPTLASG